MTEKLKTWLEIIKLGGIIGLFLVFVVKPSSLRDWCKRGGFSECNIFGAKLTPEQQNAIQLSEQVVAESKVGVTRAAEQLREITATISKVSESLNPEQKEKLEQQLAQTKETIASVEQTKSQLQQSLGELSPVVQQVASAGNWIVVFGADKTLPKAKDEIEWAKNNGYPTARLYLRQGYFRSVVPFLSRAIAQEKLADIMKSRRGDAYIVNIDTWCLSRVSHPARESDPAYDECSAA